MSSSASFAKDFQCFSQRYFSVDCNFPAFIVSIRLLYGNFLCTTSSVSIFGIYSDVHFALYTFFFSFLLKIFLLYRTYFLIRSIIMLLFPLRFHHHSRYFYHFLKRHCISTICLITRLLLFLLPN